MFMHNNDRMQDFVSDNAPLKQEKSENWSPSVYFRCYGVETDINTGKLWAVK